MSSKRNDRGEAEYKPRATQAYIDRMFKRWMEFHDIRAIGERAVRETA